MKKTALATLLVFSLFAFAQPLSAVSSGQGAERDLEGSIKGAPYKIRVPSNWNGTLLVYAHGYRDRADHTGEEENREADPAPGGSSVEQLLLARGFALAGSAYRKNGWAVEEGIKDTLRLTRFFREQVGEPRHTILWGFSMGSVIALKSIEKHKSVYDGAISGCGIGAGSSRMWDLALAFSLAYDVAFGWPASWGKPDDVRDDLDFESEVIPVILGKLANPLNLGRFEFIRLVNDVPKEDFYTGSTWLVLDMFFVTEARAELERRAGGSAVQNLNHTYSLTREEKAYLGLLGVNADNLLAAMNARRNLSAPASARNYLERNADYTGNIKNPVVSIHTRIDGLVLPANQSAYRERVEAAGKGDMLVQAFTNSVGHCSFTPEQLVAAVLAIESWLETGVRPGPESFPESLGFVPGFVASPWPQP